MAGMMVVKMVDDLVVMTVVKMVVDLVVEMVVRMGYMKV